MKLYNKYHKDAPEGSVYIGRPSTFGNPYAIGKDGTREEVVDKYKTWLFDKLKDPKCREQLKELSKSSGLVCFCSPKLCHGHILIEAMKRLRFVPVEIGDKVQWVTSDAVMHFSEPRKVVNIMQDPTHGVYAFVEGSATGVPIKELFVW